MTDYDDVVPPAGDLLLVLVDVHELLAGLIELIPKHIHSAGEQDRDSLLIVQDNLQRSWAHAMTATRYLRECAESVDSHRG